MKLFNPNKSHWHIKVDVYLFRVFWETLWKQAYGICP